MTFLDQLASGQLTPTQEFGLYVLGVTFIVCLLAINFRDQKRDSRGRR